MGREVHSDDLFTASIRDKLASSGPLAQRLRPNTLDEVIGQDHLLGPGEALRTLIESDSLTSMVLWGPPGSGKTTIARLIAQATSKSFVSLSAVASGVKEIREVLEDARRLLGEYGRGSVLFIDEVHRFNRVQQDLLLPGVEDGLVVFIGATTENPFFSINAPLLSRSTLWRLNPLDRPALEKVVKRGLDEEDITIDEDALDALVGGCDGDARAALGTLEVAVVLAKERVDKTTFRSETALIVLEDVLKARDGRIYHQGVDAHYDQASALIKSIRGSDTDAALYWLARMIDAGEDPRFIARRLVILASEDIGMADPLALGLAVAASHALDLVGLPEAALNLAQAVTYLSQAPKSNSVATALSRARVDARQGPDIEVPAHLRDSHYPGAKVLGHGVGYRNPYNE